MDTDRVRLIDMVAFACEVATVVVLIGAVNLLINGGKSWLVAIGSAVLVMAGWARWIAPNADHRLADPALFAAQAGLFLTVGGLMVAGGMFWVGFVFAVVATGVFALTRWDRMV